MATPTRLRLLEVLGDLLDLFPQFRTGQLLCNLSSLVELTPQATWDVGDDEILAEAEAFLASHRGRQAEDFGANLTTRQALLNTLAENQEEWTLGRLVANLVAYNTPPRSVIDWAGKIWDIEDVDLLASAGRAGPELEDWSPRFRRDHATSAHP